jgi:hypothetical protein
VSVHRLKPAYLPPDATPAQPPLRGRPPADPPRPPILPHHPSLPPMSHFPCLRQPVLAAPTDLLLIYQISFLHEILGGRM